MDEKDVQVIVKNDFSHEDVFIDAERNSLVNQIFQNILTNAIKFSYKNGKIIISIKEVNGKIEITFRDFGMGMPEDIKNNLFKINVKTSREGTSGEAGTGYGMPLMKSYVDYFKGEVVIDSVEKKDDEINHGTKFKLIFPTFL